MLLLHYLPCPHPLQSPCTTCPAPPPSTAPALPAQCSVLLLQSAPYYSVLLLLYAQYKCPIVALRTVLGCGQQQWDTNFTMNQLFSAVAGNCCTQHIIRVQIATTAQYLGAHCNNRTQQAADCIVRTLN